MPSGKSKLEEFFKANIGVVVNKSQLAEVAYPVTSFARRIRELRDEEKWPILTHNDLDTLKPGEYLMTGAPPVKGSNVQFSRKISGRLKELARDRNGFTCQHCGKTVGDIDEDTGRAVRLHVGHIVDKSLGGKDELDNLRTLCSSCNQGAKNVTPERPTTLALLGQVRRADHAAQRAVLDWLKQKFGDSA